MSKSPSLRRIQADIRELALDPSDQYTAAPLENDMFEWHFTIRGAVDTDFDGGIYHGRILLPPEYPFKPPHIVFLTQSGRFDINTKVCLSFSAYHPELWQPAWGIRLILEALISFLPTPGDGAIGALDYSSKERKRLAKESISYCCKQCGPIINLLPKLDPDNDERKKSDMATKKKSSSSFAKEIEELKRLQLEREGKRGGTTTSNNNNKNNNSDNKKKDNEGDGSKKDVEKDDQQQQQQKEDSTTSEEVASAAAKVEEKGKVVEEKSSSEDTKEASVAEEESNATTTTTTTDDATAAAAAAVGEVEQSNSWMYDPLLNVSIVFFCLICALFIKKAFDLSVELQALQDLPSPSPIDVKEAADAVASSLANAASSASGGGEDL